MKRKKPPEKFDAMIQFRAPYRLIQRVERAAKSKKIQPAEAYREILNTALDRLEAIDAQRTGKAKA